jgi:drug/metabolite transporter (DMT)-like permease
MQSKPSRPTRRIVLLAVAVIATGTVGNTLLRIGMSGAPPIVIPSPAVYLQALLRPAVIIGIVSLVTCLILQLTLLSWADLTFVLPITSPSYVAITVSGAWALGERVSLAHWGGVVLILCGVIVVGRTRPLTPGSGIKP